MLWPGMAIGERGDAAPSAAPEPGADGGEPSFEVALGRLEALVARLEEGELSLEQALAAFEEGVALSRRCAEQLRDAERRIEVLVREGDRLAARPFEPTSEEG
jgi:exodeoxyribonuclease VII small subunit